MKKILTIASLFSFVFLFAQNQVAKNIQDLEKNRAIFKSFTVLNTISTNTDATINKVVSNATMATINLQSVNDIVLNKYQNIEITVPYNHKNVIVDLYKVEIFSDDFQINTNKKTNIPYQRGVYYRGIVKGDYTSVVSFNFFKNECNGIISNDELSNLVVGKLAKKSNVTDYIIYADENLKVASAFQCETKDDDLPMQVANEKSNNKSALSAKCVSMYFEIDFDLFNSNGSNTTDTSNWMTSVFNNVQTLYNNDAITVALKSFYIWTDQDPYEGVGTSSTDYLYKFNQVRPVFNGDVGMLIGIDSGGLGGLAVGINGLCTQNNFCYGDINYSYATVPTYSWTIEVITHELGHLLGSRHTHSCVWNGNNTAIDNCASSAQGSSAEGYSCRTTPLTIPSSTTKGTIMSYCHLVNNVGIKLSNGFGPQPKNAILNAISNGTCLSSDCINTCINTVSSVQISNVTQNTASVNWVESGNFTSWEVRVYPFGGTGGAWTPVSTNSYTVSGLNPDTYYVAQVRPSCTSGLTSSNRELEFITSASYCDGLQFSDSGGPFSDYSNMETFVRTIIPNIPSNAIVLSFTDFSLELDYDYLNIYDGNSTAAPQLSTSPGFTGASNPGTFTSTAPDGSLTVTFFSDQGVVSSGFVANISCTPNLSVNNQNGYIDFSYYPNPSNGKLTINSKTPLERVLVYNVAGQLLYEKSTNELTSTVDISEFATGTYFFKLKFEGEKEANFKVLKM